MASCTIGIATFACTIFSVRRNCLSRTSTPSSVL